jgi:hypothetical protein
MDTQTGREFPTVESGVSPTPLGEQGVLGSEPPPSEAEIAAEAEEQALGKRLLLWGAVGAGLGWAGGSMLFHGGGAGLVGGTTCCAIAIAALAVYTKWHKAHAARA